MTRTTLYTLVRAKYGNPVKEHGSDDCKTTTCGLAIDDAWIILTNAKNGKITCKQCLTVLRKEATA